MFGFQSSIGMSCQSKFKSTSGVPRRLDCFVKDFTIPSGLFVVKLKPYIVLIHFVVFQMKHGGLWLAGIHLQRLESEGEAEYPAVQHPM